MHKYLPQCKIKLNNMSVPYNRKNDCQYVILNNAILKHKQIVCTSVYLFISRFDIKQKCQKENVFLLFDGLGLMQKKIFWSEKKFWTIEDSSEIKVDLYPYITSKWHNNYCD